MGKRKMNGEKSFFTLGTSVAGKRLLAFDLDGTMTQHRTPPSGEVYGVLRKLSQKYRLLMVGAGDVLRIDRQMEHFPIDVLGNYGMQFGKRLPDGSLEITDLGKYEPDRQSVEDRVSFLREKYGYTSFAGDSVEFHSSGVVTIPLLGTKADIKDKIAFDPDRSKRRAIYDFVKSLFPEYIVFVGGSSSFDMSPAPFDKGYALSNYCKKNGIPESGVLYFGDDYGPGGNDEAVLKAGFDFVRVDDYRDFPKIIKDIFG